MFYNRRMPKIVNHDLRRREILEAVRRVLLRQGLAGATVRAVVTESGLSSGAIRHYFASHGEMLRFAAEGISHQVTQRVAAARDSRRSPQDKAIAMLEELLPLDDVRRMEISLNVDLFRLTGDTTWGWTTWQGVRRFCRAAVLVLAESDRHSTERALRPARREHLAERLHMIVDGTAATTMFYGITPRPEQMRAGLVRAVDDVGRELRETGSESR